MDDYFTMQPSQGVHNEQNPGDSVSPASGYVSPLDSPTPSPPSLAPDPVVEGARTKKVLSPSELVSVLRQEVGPVPKAQARFLHGGPPLSELEAPSTVLLGATLGTNAGQKPIATARWRAFTDQEQVKLEAGWEKLEAERREERAKKEKKERKKDRQGEAEEVKEAVEAGALDPGLDNLFSVSLSQSILYPAFWTGTPVRVIRATWFYAPPSTSSATSHNPSHLLKPYPVDTQLSASLERAYASIRPWEDHYAAELDSALKGGLVAQKRVCTSLKVANESGVDVESGSGIEVIFQGEDEGRVYSQGWLGGMGKSFWTSGKGLGGGQVVLRGWDAMRNYHANKNKSKLKSTPKKPRASGLPDSAIDTSSDLDSSSPTSSPAPRSRTTSSSSTHRPNVSEPSLGAGFFASLKNKLGGAPTTDDVDDASPEHGENERANETAEAMGGPRNKETGGVGEVGEVDELVLVCHGIGQKLAASYEGFNFVHAVNQLRSACTTLSTSPTLSPLLHSQRAQFIPLLWRADLSFDDVDESEDSAEEHLRNSFSLDDIEIKGSVPFLRQVVSGLVLDVPFYLSHHKVKMMRAVVKEANRIYRLFCSRNPTFAKNGRVSIIAHSLGSALVTDILSAQPTFVKPLKEMTREEKYSEEKFVFDTRIVILVGSPLGFFLHLGKGQLIARKGRARTKKVGRDIALDRAGRYGCMAVDAVYNVYHETDPVAFALNPAVDVKYSRIIKPIAVASSNQTLLQNLTETYNRVSKMFDVSSLWSSTPTPTSTTTEAEKEKEDTVAETLVKEGGPPKVRRPGLSGKRMPSERPMSSEQFELVSRAEQRFNALNPNGCVDFYLPSEGFNQYIDALSSHAGYWTDPRFSTFVLTQLFAGAEDLEKTGREEIATEFDENDEV